MADRQESVNNVPAPSLQPDEGGEMTVRSVTFSTADDTTVRGQMTESSKNDGSGQPAGGKDAVRARAPETSRAPREVNLPSLWSKARGALEEAAQNRGREANALKSLHDYLRLLSSSPMSESEKLEALSAVTTSLSRIRDWDKPQWFKNQPGTVKDASGKLVSEAELVQQRNRLTKEQMQLWDDWAAVSGKSYIRSAGSADEQIAALDSYIVKRVALDSIKNWLRRRPAEQFVNEMFAALAQNKLYLHTAGIHLRALKDESGQVRAVEMRDGQLYFEGTDEQPPVHTDEGGAYVELPDDSDMIVFERRTINGQKQIVPVAQPNGRDPNIQWFSGAAVKRGWNKEQRFFAGPDSISLDELYGFFPDHFPMRLTNSTENRVPTEKAGGAIYGYAKEHAGRQARHLIVEFGEVMPGLKRNNSQLINDARHLFGLQKTVVPVGSQAAPSQAV
ncbi:MAG TPA: hypothetical protein V6D22_12635 [Candidatus Obscuribacterales bacterium]